MPSEEILAKLIEIGQLQAQHSVLLSEHMRRTAALEASVELVRTELAPIKAHVAIFGVIGKILGAAGVITGIITGILSAIR